MSILQVDTVTSTMDAARELVLAGRWRPGAEAAACNAIVAKHQSQGRGQRGRAWIDEPGSTLCATFHFDRGMVAPEAAAPLAILSGIAVAEAIHRISLASHGIPTPQRAGRIIRVGLKWPNDVLLNGKKVAGTLVELIRSPQRRWVALIGVGVNVFTRRFPDGLAQPATSLLLEGLEAPPLDQIAACIAASLARQADRYRDAGIPALLRRWRCYDETPGKSYSVEVDGRTAVCQALGVDASGGLVVRLPGGAMRTLFTATHHNS